MNKINQKVVKIVFINYVYASKTCTSVDISHTPCVSYAQERFQESEEKNHFYDSFTQVKGTVSYTQGKDRSVSYNACTFD